MSVNVIDIRKLEKALRPHPAIARKLRSNVPLTPEEESLLHVIAYLYGAKFEATGKAATCRHV